MSGVLIPGPGPMDTTASSGDESDYASHTDRANGKPTD